MRIGYYVHHHGRGHATRAGVIGAELTRRGHVITYLGSGALPDGDQVALASDADEADAPFVDPDAGGRLHWAPLGGGYAERSAQIAAWVTQARPDVVVVDVSVEVAALVRMLGVHVVVVAQPGRRDDAPHALAFDLAAAVLAPWPARLDVAPHLERHRDKTVEVGGLSRFAGHAAGPNAAGGGSSACPSPNSSESVASGPRAAGSRDAGGCDVAADVSQSTPPGAGSGGAAIDAVGGPSLGARRGASSDALAGSDSDGAAVNVPEGLSVGTPRGAFSDATSRGAQEIPRLRGVLLVGGEGWDDAELPGAVERAVPQVHWRTPDADHPVEVLLATADVVVTHAGQNALADVAAFGVPAVVVPQERPFDEQADMARALDDAGIARRLTLGATADEVAAGIRELLAGDDERSTGRAWARWCVDGAVDRAADVIEAAARGGVADLAAGTEADDLGGAVRGSRHGIDDVARAGVAERGVREAGGAARGVVEGGSGWPAATGAETPALGDGTLP